MLAKGFNLFKLLSNRYIILRYFTSGGIGAFTDLSLLYLFTEKLYIHYIVSTAVAFLIAFCVSFTLQKLWTFQDRTTDTLGKQAATFFCIVLVTASINTALVFALVHYLEVWYLGAQVVVALLIAAVNFLGYRRLVFLRPRVTSS